MKLPLCFALLLLALGVAARGVELPPMQPLEMEGDLSAQMVEGISRWLDRETERVAADRRMRWDEFVEEVAEAENGERKLLQKRGHLDRALGVVTLDRAFQEMRRPRMYPVGHYGPVQLSRLQWSTAEGLAGEGLLAGPRDGAVALVLLIPDADESPELVLGLTNERSPYTDCVNRLVAARCAVIVPRLISRSAAWSGNAALNRWTNQPAREWIYRQSFEMGRTLTGYEATRCVEAVNAYHQAQDRDSAGLPVGIAGFGEGGLIAMHAAALSSSGFESVLISGHFGPRENLWEEPIDRNVFGLLREFGDAELAALSESKKLVIEYSESPAVDGPPPPADGRRGAAPGKIRTPALAGVKREFERAKALRSQLDKSRETILVHGPNGETAPVFSGEAIRAFTGGLLREPISAGTEGFKATRDIPREDGLAGENFRQLEHYTQRLIPAAERVRYQNPLWTKQGDFKPWTEAQTEQRRRFWEEVMGKIPTDYLPPRPRSRQTLDKPKWTGHEIVLDVHPDIFAWGILLVPKDLKPGERRPVVVCQHGLEGLPMDTITDDRSSQAWQAYKGFAAQLADLGYIVYAPHNPYRGGDKFRVLQRKANPLGLSLFSFIIAQHDVTTRWLASLPFVDPEKIAFYGLSYGGKTAMRVPAVLERYCLSICSGDFNEWVLKNASTEHSFSYMFTGEYEIFEWDLGHTFNYAEMALLIAPRPFMVERGHGDAVAASEWVGYEFAKVLRGYTRLGFPDRAEIEWFDGPHTIHGVGTFRFLQKHLHWPEAK